MAKHTSAPAVPATPNFTCVDIDQAIDANGRQLAICDVVRFHPHHGGSEGGPVVAIVGNVITFMIHDRPRRYLAAEARELIRHLDCRHMPVGGR